MSIFRKDDICFRRFKPVQNKQLSQSIQTDVTIGATDLLNIQRIGEHIENNAIFDSSKRLNPFVNKNTHHRKQPDSKGSRSPIRYRSEKISRYESRDYKHHDRDRYATRTRSTSRRISEERKHRHDEGQNDNGHERNSIRDRYEAPDRSKKRDVGQHKYKDEESVQPAIKDARDILRKKRARESTSNDRYVI